MAPNPAHCIFIDHSRAVIRNGVLNKLLERGKSSDTDASLYAFSAYVVPLPIANQIAGEGCDFYAIERFMKDSKVYPNEVTVFTGNDPLTLINKRDLKHPERWTFFLFDPQGNYAIKTGAQLNDDN